MSCLVRWMISMEMPFDWKQKTKQCDAMRWNWFQSPESQKAHGPRSTSRVLECNRDKLSLPHGEIYLWRQLMIIVHTEEWKNTAYVTFFQMHMLRERDWPERSHAHEDEKRMDLSCHFWTTFHQWNPKTNGTWDVSWKDTQLILSCNGCCSSRPDAWSINWSVDRRTPSKTGENLFQQSTIFYNSGRSSRLTENSRETHHIETST